jgi:hypothetical protein
MKVEASLHGAKIEGESKRPESDDSIMFKDPKEYEKLSPEEKKKLTESMLSKVFGIRGPAGAKIQKFKKDKRVK